MDTLTNILSLNVGMSASLVGLNSLIVTNSVDLILLQEVTIPSEQLLNALGNSEFQAVVNIDVDATNLPGTAVVWRRSLPVDEVLNIVTCRAQLVKLGPYAIFNVYAPSGSGRRQERNTFFSQELFQAFCLFPNSTKLLAGDFNCLLNPLDVEDGKGFGQKYCPALTDLVKSFDLVDSFRAQFPTRKEFTYLLRQFI